MIRLSFVLLWPLSFREALDYLGFWLKSCFQIKMINRCHMFAYTWLNLRNKGPLGRNVLETEPSVCHTLVLWLRLYTVEGVCFLLQCFILLFKAGFQFLWCHSQADLCPHRRLVLSEWAQRSQSFDQVVHTGHRQYKFTRSSLVVPVQVLGLFSLGRSHKKMKYNR